MAHYSLVLFSKHETSEVKSDILVETVASVDGFIIDNQVLMKDSLRWMFPDMDEQKLQSMFEKLLKKAELEANKKGYSASLIYKHF